LLHTFAKVDSFKDAIISKLDIKLLLLVEINEVEIWS